MALAFATAGTAAATNTDNSVQTINVTVSTDDILVIHAGGRDTASTPAIPTLTDNGAGAIGTWTNVGTGVNGAIGSNQNRQHVQYAVVATGGSYTVTCTWQATIIALAIGATKISGADTSSPFGAQAAVNATGSSTAPNAGTMSALASTSNSRLLFVTSRATSGTVFTPDAAYTELYEAGSSDGNQIAAAYLTDGASDDTTPAGTLSNVAWKASGLEVSVAPAGTGQPAARRVARIPYGVKGVRIY